MIILYTSFYWKNNILIEQIVFCSTCSVVVGTGEVDIIIVDDDETAPVVGGDAIDWASKCLNCKPMLWLYLVIVKWVLWMKIVFF